MSEKYIAVRLKSIHQGEERFVAKGSRIVNSRMEKREPALKNITDALHDLGLAYDIDGNSLFWLLITDDQPVASHLAYADVEAGFEAEWFEAQKARIRGYSGIDYFDACVELAKTLPLKDQTRLVIDKITASVSASATVTESASMASAAKDSASLLNADKLQESISESLLVTDGEHDNVVAIDKPQRIPQPKRKPRAKNKKRTVRDEVQLELF